MRETHEETSVERPGEKVPSMASSRSDSRVVSALYSSTKGMFTSSIRMTTVLLTGAPSRV